MDIVSRLACCLLLIAMFAATAQAATVRGRVATEAGRPIRNVQVTLAPQSNLSHRSDLHQTIDSDGDGRFTFADLPNGSYQLQFDKRYWEPVYTHVIVTGADRNIEVEMSMQLLFATLAKVQLMSFAYGVMFGIALLWLNYYLVPVPIKSLTWAGWIVIGLSLTIGTFKLEFVHTGLLAFGGIVIGWYVQWRGSRLAVGRRDELDREAQQREQAHEHDRQQIVSLVGKQGIAVTHLKACGMADIDGRSVEVRAESGFIDKNTPIIVRALEGSMPVVTVIAE